MSNLAPDGWTIQDLGDVTEKIEGGGTPSRTEPAYWNGDIPWVTVKDLKKVRLSFAEESISALGLKESASRLIPKNTLIIATRMALGKAVMFDRAVTINQDLKAVFPKRDLDSEYLLHWYLSKAESIQSMGSGSTVKGIRLDDLRLIPIALPPLKEQQKIASILTAVDEVIESTQAQINKLKDLKTGMMQELLTKGIGHTEFKDSPVGRIPESWETAKIDSLSNKIWIGLVTTMTANYVEEGVPLIRNSDIKESYVRLEKMIFLSYEFAEKHKSRMVRVGDVVTVHTGDVGTSAVIDSALDGAHGFATINTRVNRKFLLPEFLCEMLNSNLLKYQIKAVVTGDGRDNLNLKDFIELKVAYPSSIDEQRGIISIIHSIRKRIAIQEEKMLATQKIKKALMQDLLTGAVRVLI